MTKDTIRQYEMLVRLDEFGTAHDELFPAGSAGAESLAEVRGAVTEIEAQETARRGAVGEGSVTRRTGRAGLGRTLNRIRQTAMLLGLEDPATGESFPRWDAHKSDQALLQTARSYATDAAPLADRFIKEGMPAMFMADLQAEIDAFAGALDRRQRGRATTGEAHSRMRAAIDRGQLAARRLDAFLANTREHDDPLLETWKGIRRISPMSRSRKPESAGTGSSTGTGTTTPAVTPGTPSTPPVRSVEAVATGAPATPISEEVPSKGEAA